jgi:Dolichyl-phosphate-mannose-protein mannosyltransferase
LALLSLLFAAAFSLRLVGIGEPPMDFIPMRQYHGAILARGLHDWLLNGELKTIPPDGILEPPILELMASIAYLLSGAEHLWVPRLLSALFWMVGGIFLYLIAKKMSSPNAAVFAVCFYLFNPYCVLASRAFMPDPLMVMLLVISIYAIVRYHEEPSARGLLVAAGASSLCVFVKPGICVFLLFGAFLALAVHRRGIRKALLASDLLSFGALTVGPAALYFLYGMFIAGFLQGQVEYHVEHKIVPGLVLDPTYWRGWLDSIETLIGYAAFVGALLGVLLRSGFPRALLIGLWGGYLLFGLTFTYHIQTHIYYSLQLVPVVALSLGLLWEAVASWLRHVDLRFGKVAAVGLLLPLLLLAVVASVPDYQKTVLSTARSMQGEYPQGESGQIGFTTDYEELATAYREIGQAVHHSRRTIFLAPEFGYPLIYHGRLDGVWWPPPSWGKWWRHDEHAPAESERAYFENLYSADSPQYFIAIKHFRAGAQEVENWKDDGLLRDLGKDFPVVARDDAYIVFHLKKGEGDGASSLTTLSK